LSKNYFSCTKYTDNRGNANANKMLSKKRADAVMRFLIDKGIDQERIITNGYGEKFPKESNNTEKGRRANRRVEIYLLKPRA